MIHSAIRPSIRAMAGYTPGEQLNDPAIIKLNTNENPYPPSPRVLEAIQAALLGDQLRKYPDPTGSAFRKAAGKVLGIDPEAIVIGNGSDDILTILTRAFVPSGGQIATLTPSYILYQTLADIQGATLRLVPFSQNWRPPSPWPYTDSHLTFLANPNSPSGTALDRETVRQLAGELAGPLVLDEAYADFADWNGLELFAELPNLIITRSFSKYYALAGIRFGFAIADPVVVRELVKVKDSYNCDRLSLVAATAAIEDQEYYSGIRSRVIATRRRMIETLAQLGFQVTPSQANFVWCRRTDQPLKPIYEALKARKILIRYMHYPDYGDGLRISVGTDAEIDQLFHELRAIL